ncbi:type II toxin-antitoxin system RelE/ParE family toxin [Desemzia sp. FAM 23989]|uniref:type II toxin-antitoxin system RelE/ParE family toxin n=1 Tax=Desemzia sp. FAM 23989 TaxID=3259523 RepID=UPI00388B6EC4
MKKYEIEIYEDRNGNSQILEWIQYLDAHPSKLNSSMLRKFYYQIERLEHEGPFVGEPIAKRIDGKLWELRPVPNRVFFGILENNQLILLHQFRKKSQKTPRKEIEQAKREYDDWIKRKRND